MRRVEKGIKKGSATNTTFSLPIFYPHSLHDSTSLNTTKDTLSRRIFFKSFVSYRCRHQRSLYLLVEQSHLIIGVRCIKRQYLRYWRLT
nr:MAG TPA: hypothetical protein [Caudoviricetes sp.]DAX58869.1 MAG TPA: hypothetical protein [Caudoviricetes sp.]